MGLRDDLDDLRAELAEELEDFETRLADIADELPEWLEVPDDSLRTPFVFEEPPPLQGTLLGPRAVAVVAGDLEEFVGRWLGDDDVIPVWNEREDDEAVDQMCDDFRALRSETDTAIEATETLADDGPLRLEQILESIVFELESRRESDVEALEDLIQNGDVEPGRDARAEIAELWEEQRNRVDRLREIWDDLLNLHHDGVTRTLDGLEQIRRFVEQARQGIEGAAIAGPARLSTHRDNTGDEPSDSTPAPSKQAAETSPMPRVSEPEVTFEEISSRFVRDHLDAPTDSAEESETAETEPPGAATTEVSQQASPTESGTETTEQMAMATATADMTPPVDDSAETDASDGSDRADHTTPTEETSPRDDGENDTKSQIDESQVDESVEIPPDDAVHDSEHDDEDAPVDDTPGRTSPSDGDYLRVRVVRARQGWHPVGLDKIAAILCVPVLFVAGLVVLSLLSVAGLAPNPMTTWEWTLPAGFGVMALLLILPLTLGWRPMWDGTDFDVIRRATVEEDVDLRITPDDELIVDRMSWAISDLDRIRLRHWADREDRRRGCLLTITPPYHSPIHLVSRTTGPEDDDPDLEARDLPEDAWRLPSEEFERLAEILDPETPDG